MKKILLLLSALLLCSLGTANSPQGTTDNLFELKLQAGESIPEIAREEFYRLIESRATHSSLELNRNGWTVIDELDLRAILPAGEQIGSHFNHVNNASQLFLSQGELLPEAIAALEKAPEWMYYDLHHSLSHLSPERQRIWADLINETSDPYVDEIAFCVAYSAHEYLESEFSTPEMFVENVEMIYYVEPQLDYVEIIHHGNSQTDPNYYSTISYKRRNTEGIIEHVQVPKEIYYKYVVHPKITGEIPAYIDPDIIECMETRTNNIVDPGQGDFWRSFLWDVQDVGYPVLSDTLKQVETLYNQDESPGCAIRAIHWWVRETLEFTSGPERPHQPVRIYRKHIGRCGEWADYTAAVARTGLIPTTNVSATSIDHTWNEFWDEEWKQWEPALRTGIDNPYRYEDWGGGLGSVYQRRNDGYLPPVTQRYMQSEVAKITLTVVDTHNNPIDGARILLATRDLEDSSRLRFDTYGFTDNDGVVVFPVGKNRDYFARAETPIGNVPEEDGIVARLMEGAQEGRDYFYRLTVESEIPGHLVNDIPLPDEPHSGRLYALSYSVPKYYISGKAPIDNMPGGYTFNQMVDSAGEVNFLITDYDNWTFYRYANLCDAYEYQTLIQDGEYKFNIPANHDFYAYLDNSHRLNNAQYLQGAMLYAEGKVSVEDEVIEPGIVKLYNNHPNPFNPNTVIPFYLPHSQHVIIEIYNLKGQKIKTLIDDIGESGLNNIMWEGKNDEGKNVGSGVYFYRLITEGYNETQKMILMK